MKYDSLYGKFYSYEIWMHGVSTKGQLISEWNFGIFKSPKKNQPFFLEGSLSYEAKAEILQEKGSLFGKFGFLKISFWDQLTFK